MITVLLSEEILSNPEWRLHKNFDVECSKAFKQLIDNELIDIYIQNHQQLGTKLPENKKDIKINKLYLPHGFWLEFIVTRKTGYEIKPKPTEE